MQVSGNVDLKQVLVDLGYPVEEQNNYLKIPAYWRSGSDPSSVTIYYKDSNCVVDHVVGEKFSIEALISKILGLETIEEGSKYLREQKKCVLPAYEAKDKVLIKEPKIFPLSDLDNILPVHDYILKRGISLDVAKEFRGGECRKKCRLSNRYVWPIFSSKDLVGFTGRTLENDKRKYVHFGNKTQWCWPCFLNIKDIQKAGSVVLVESPVCVQSLFTVGIRNVMCLFGTELGLGPLNLFLKLNLNRIIIATNNEKSGVGQEAAEKIEKKLLKYFDRKTVKICLPERKDFNEMLMENEKSIVDWYNAAL